MKKIVIIILVLIINSSLYGCSKDQNNNQEMTNNPTENQTVTPITTATTAATATVITPVDPNIMPTDEVERAIWYGFVPEVIQIDLDSQITLSQYGTMLGKMIEMVNKDALPKWQEVTAKAMQLNNKMLRDEGMLMAFYAADALGETSLDGVAWDSDWGTLDQKIGSENKFLWDYYYFDNWDSQYPGGWEGQDFNYFVSAYMFSMGKTSKVSRHTLFDYDAEENSMREGDPFTRREAILSTIRLYESVIFNTSILLEEAKPADISKQTIAMASNMPPASNTKIPEWYGYTLDNMMDNRGGSGILFWEQDIQNLSKLGITFVRVNLDLNLVFKGEDFNQVNEVALRNMDNLITWCIENGIHVNFDLHNMPGYTMNNDESDDTLFQNQKQQDLFIKFWSFMAERYSSIPNNALSFNLINEPKDNITEASYSKLMIKAIDAIRVYSPDRLIFVDMLNISRTPVYQLVDSGVAQSIHQYIPGISGLNDNNSEYVLKETWPIYLINGMVQRNNKPFSLTGDFKAGSTLTIRIDGFHSNGEIVVKSEGNEIGRFPFGEEQEGENYCTQINDKGTGGEWRRYEGAGFKIDISEDTKEIELSLSGKSSWFTIQGISIQNNDQNILIYANNGVVTSYDDVTLVISEDGNISAENPDTIVTLDENYFDLQMKKYSDFSEETGIPVMVQEFGVDKNTEYQLTLQALNAQVESFNKYGIGWCIFSGNYGFLATKEDEKRNGAEYEQIGSNRWLDKGMISILQKYMQPN